MEKKRIKRIILGAVAILIMMATMYVAGWTVGNNERYAAEESALINQDITEYEVETKDEKLFSDYQIIDDDKDFWKMQPITEGSYQVGQNTVCIVKNGEARIEGINYSSPLLKKAILAIDRFDHTCLIGVNKYTRELTIISFKKDGTCWETSYKYADIPNEVVYQNDFEFIDNSHGASLVRVGTKYSVYCELEEKAYFDIGKKLEFIYPSIAVDEIGGVYRISYSNNPWKIEIEKIDEGISNVEMSFYAWPSNASLFSYEKDNKKYIIIPNYEEVFSMEKIPCEDTTGLNLDEFPEKYSIIEYCTENMETICFTYGGDSLRFEKEEKIKIGETELTSCMLEKGIKKNYLSIIIPAEELAPYMEDIKNPNEAKVNKRVEQLKQFLNKWEKENPEKIAKAMKQYEFLLEEDGDDWGAKEWAEAHQDLLK